jgi:hypothetical protein
MLPVHLGIGEGLSSTGEDSGSCKSVNTLPFAAILREKGTGLLALDETDQSNSHSPIRHPYAPLCIYLF